MASWILYAVGALAVALVFILVAWPAIARSYNAASMGRLVHQLEHAGLSRRRDVLLVFAHPDDEAMFFSPTLAALKAGGIRFHLLCFSSGNYAGLGVTRAAELHASGMMYGAASTTVVEDPRTQDGPVAWDAEFIAARTAEHMRETSGSLIGAIVTFDRGGVSGHSNHVDVHRGIKLLIAAPSSFGLDRPLLGYELVSKSMPVKYSGPLELLAWHRAAPAFAAAQQASTDELRPALALRFMVQREQALLSLAGMRAHRSQLVWFRYLFVAFSQYGFFNELRPMRSSNA
jgi:N-acetylglucosaminylphosphatidylinositol deacetylase